MKQIKTIKRTVPPHLWNLDKAVNDWLKDNQEVDIIDIKFILVSDEVDAIIIYEI